MKTAMHPKDRFLGEWSLYRHIFDLDSQWLGRFVGTASLDPNLSDEGEDLGDSLTYFEHGKLQFGGLTAIDATRRYFWHFPDDEHVEVTFDDGRAFHHFEPNAGRSEATHFCEPDTYDVTYDFTAWPIWRVEWRVEGPRKDYRMVSVYSPLEPEVAPKPVLDRLIRFFSDNP